MIRTTISVLVHLKARASSTLSRGVRPSLEDDMVGCSVGIGFGFKVLMENVWLEAGKAACVEERDEVGGWKQ